MVKMDQCYGLRGLCFGLAVFFTAGTAWAFSGSGSGIDTDPYVITDVNQLQEMNDALGAYYVLGNDIDASATSTWNGGEGFAPVGTFTGNLNGQSYTISGLYIQRPSIACALFYCTDGAIIKNVGLANVNITGGSGSAALIGESLSTTTTRCWSSGSINSSKGYLGGLVSKNKTGSIISKCYSLATVNSNDKYRFGGLVGFHLSDSVIENSYARGNVTGKNVVGGLVGSISGDPVAGHISRCYSTGLVTANDVKGGLIGGNGSGMPVTNCYWDVETSGCSYSDGGTGKSTADMKQQASYANWDFVNVWSIDEGNDYPVLREPIPGLMIGASPAAMDFYCTMEDLLPDDQLLHIFNDGEGTLNWTLSEACDWLTAVPASGSSSGEMNDVIVSVNATGLSLGDYTCDLVVEDPCAVNSPLTVQVTLHVVKPTYFLVGEIGEPWHNDCYLLPLIYPDDIDDARELIIFGPGTPWTMDSIVVANYAAWNPADGINPNRNYLQPGMPAWSWVITEFGGFAGMTAEVMDGWPGAIEQGIPIANPLGFWSYTVVAEFGTDLEPWFCDLTVDGHVDVDDFEWFSDHWLESGCGHRYWCGGADLDGSGQVDLKDFEFMANHWLWHE